MGNPNSSGGNENSIPPQVLAEFIEIAHSVSAIYSQIIAKVEPQVLRVIETNNKDVIVIENLLDQLLDVCDDDQALRLFRLLCRHYWGISQVNTAIYIDGYRTMWETKASATEASKSPICKAETVCVTVER